MYSTLTRGAVVALLTIGSLPLAAQTPVVVTRPQSDTGMRIVISGPRRISLDSITVLMRAFDQEQVGSPAMINLGKQIDRLTAEMAAGHMMFGAEQAATMAAKMSAPKGWIGINALGPRARFVSSTGVLEEYYDYQPIVSVDPDSPAQKAGVSPGDLLVAYNGVDLRGHQFNLTRMFAPDQKLQVTVRRDGETKDFSMTVVKTPEVVFLRRRDLDAAGTADVRISATLRGEDMTRPPMAGRTMFVSPGTPGGGNFVFRVFPADGNGVFGAKLLALGPELARRLKLDAGLLVDEVPEESPAYKSGLRTADVIVGAGGQPVSSVKQLIQVLMVPGANSSDRSATLSVMRDGKPRKITVTW